MLYLRGTGTNRHYRCDRVEITPHGSMLSLVAVVTAPEERSLPSGSRVIGKLLYTGGWMPFAELTGDPAFIAAAKGARPGARLLTAVCGPDWKAKNRWVDEHTHILS